MPVYFIPADRVQQEQVTISGHLLHHLRASLRAQIGDTIWLGDERRCRYLVRITHIDHRRLLGQIEEQQKGPPQTNPSVVLGQALLKGEKMDWVIQKGTELGAASVHPLVTTHTIARPLATRVNKQVERWQRIALEAAQQSERWDIPTITAPQHADNFFTKPLSDSHNLILCERAHCITLTSVALPSGADRMVVLTVGPEGGWSGDELDQALAHGFIPVTLGSRILRAETAAVAGLAILQSRLGNLG